MSELSIDTKKSLLGQKGLALVIDFLSSKNVACVIPTDVLDPEIDLWMYPLFPDKKVKIGSQVKTKVPWIYEQSQSFTYHQWEKYKHLDSIWMICVPASEKHIEKDKWFGNVYHFNPKNVKTNLKTTQNGRTMILIPLNQFAKPTFVITNPIDLNQLKRFSTEEE